MNTQSTFRPESDDVAPVALAPVEESLLADERAGLTPCEMVERKLAGLLKSNPMTVSQLIGRRRLLRSQ